MLLVPVHKKKTEKVGATDQRCVSHAYDVLVCLAGRRQVVWQMNETLGYEDRP